MSYQFVEQLHKKAVTVDRLCRVLGVSRSGYYGSRQRDKLAPKACLVSTQLKAEFAASGRVYGSRRLGAVLRAQGLRIGRHRVRRLMRENRLRALWRPIPVNGCRIDFVARMTFTTDSPLELTGSPWWTQGLRMCR